jgi:hypothetical protein
MPDASEPANKDGTYDQHQWENLTAQLTGATDALAEANAQLDAERQAHTVTKGERDSARESVLTLQSMLGRTMTHVGNAWDALGGDQAAVDRRRAELEAQLAALK